MALGSIGLLAGGVLTDLISWHWIFFVNVPVGVFAFAVALTRIAESRDEGAGTEQGMKQHGEVKNVE